MENPHDEGQARYISLSIYESATDTVLAKTFDNLNRPDPFSYEIQGIEVTMN